MGPGEVIFITTAVMIKMGEKRIMRKSELKISKILLKRLKKSFCFILF